MCLKQKEVNTCSFRKPVERIMNARYSRYKRNRFPSYRWMCDHDEAPRRSTVLSSLIYTNNKKHQPFRAGNCSEMQKMERLSVEACLCWIWQFGGLVRAWELQRGRQTATVFVALPWLSASVAAERKRERSDMWWEGERKDTGAGRDRNIRRREFGGRGFFLPGLRRWRASAPVSERHRTTRTQQQLPICASQNRTKQTFWG